MKSFIKKYKWFFAIWVVLIAIGGYFEFKTLASEEGSDQQYTTGEVERGTLLVTVSTTGSVVAQESSEINTNITGEVEEILVSEGDIVKENQVLFKIKNDNLDAVAAVAQTTYLQTQEAVNQAELDKISAKRNLNDLKAKDKKDDSSVSDFEIDFARQKVETARLAIQAAQDKVLQAKITYEEALEDVAEKDVRAPTAGVVFSLNLSVGDKIGGTDKTDSLVTVINLDSLLIQVEVNEMDITNVQKDQKATITLDALTSNKKYTGKVTKVNDLGINEQGVVSYQVEISFDSLDSAIKSGMTVSAEIIIERKESVLIVPTSAVKTKGQENFVQVLQEGGTTQDVTVKLGLSSDNQTELLEGLVEGDVVVTGTLSSDNEDRGPAGGFGIPGMGGMRPR